MLSGVVVEVGYAWRGEPNGGRTGRVMPRGGRQRGGKQNGVDITTPTALVNCIQQCSASDMVVGRRVDIGGVTLHVRARSEGTVVDEKGRGVRLPNGHTPSLPVKKWG